MSWHFSRALVEASLEENFWDGGQFVPSKLILIASLNLSKDKMTKYSRISQSGMTFVLLTERAGEELLTWYQEDFLAKEFRLQAREEDLMTNVPVFGKKCSESFAKLDQKSSGWKTPHFLPGVESSEFSGTWPRWGMMQSGECWELTMSGLHTSENEYGFWHTPCANEPGINPDRLVCQDGSPPLWPTPTVSGNNNRKGASKKSGDGLATAVKKFPTPRANSGSGPSRVGHRTDLQTQAGGPLNPMWVEWLMGWPIGWTALEPLEMDRFQQWLDLHGKC